MTATLEAPATALTDEDLAQAFASHPKVLKRGLHPEHAPAGFRLLGRGGFKVAYLHEATNTVWKVFVDVEDVYGTYTTFFTDYEASWWRQEQDGAAAFPTTSVDGHRLRYAETRGYVVNDRYLLQQELLTPLTDESLALVERVASHSYALCGDRFNDFIPANLGWDDEGALVAFDCINIYFMEEDEEGLRHHSDHPSPRRPLEG